jgi:hypothetical protein
VISAVKNLFIILKEAIIKSVSLIVKRTYKSKSVKSKFAQESYTRNLGTTVVDKTFDNPYEPILEKYIYKYVILEVSCSDNTIIEISGYLLDYSPKFISIVNMEHTFINKEFERYGLSQDVDNSDIKINSDDNFHYIKNKRKNFLVIKDSSGENNLNLVVFFDKTAKISKQFKEVSINFTNRIDLIISRENGRIRHKSIA